VVRTVGMIGSRGECEVVDEGSNGGVLHVLLVEYGAERCRQVEVVG
jgi:hypothetical protein